MAIVKCTQCKFIREVDNQHEGKRAKCPSCQTQLHVQNSVALVTDLSEEISQLHEEILQLKQNVRLTCDEATKIKSGYAFANLDSSPIFENYNDIIQWFNGRQIKVEPNQAAMDISGFFDEVAVKLGDNYAILGELCEKIKHSQHKWGKFTLNLVSYNQKNSQIVIGFLKELYDNAFITRYVYDKMNKRVHISLQTTPKITNFFNGDWLEWYVLMKVATLLVDKKVKFSCLRGFHVHFPDADKNEIDLFFLINGSIPLWIECKSGEFRQFISKYSTLRKRLKLEKSDALLLVLGMPDEKVVGLTNTFELTVVNENNFLKQIEQKIAPVKRGRGS